jgi:hypothetical protein
MAYIDKDLLIKDIGESVVFTVRNAETSPELRGARKIIDRIENAPTADVVEVVRCGQCKDFEPHGNGKGGICRNRKCKGLRYATDFCSYGERKEK